MQRASPHTLPPFRISTPIAQNQGQGTDGPEKYSYHLFRSDGFFQKESR